MQNYLYLDVTMEWKTIPPKHFGWAIETADKEFKIEKAVIAKAGGWKLTSSKELCIIDG